MVDEFGMNFIPHVFEHLRGMEFHVYYFTKFTNMQGMKFHSTKE